MSMRRRLPNRRLARTFASSRWPSLQGDRWLFPRRLVGGNLRRRIIRAATRPMSRRVTPASCCRCVCSTDAAPRRSPAHCRETVTARQPALSGPRSTASLPMTGPRHERQHHSIPAAADLPPFGSCAPRGRGSSWPAVSGWLHGDRASAFEDARWLSRKPRRTDSRGGVMSTARDLTLALGGTWHGSYGSCQCPVHEDRSPSLSVKDGEHGLIVHCFAGCDWYDIKCELHRRGLIERSPRRARDHRPDQSTTKATRSPERIPKWGRGALPFRIWHCAEEAPGTLAEVYLRSRGLTLPVPPTLRFQWLKHAPSNGIHPCMIALVQHGVTGRRSGFIEPSCAATDPGRPTLIRSRWRSARSPAAPSGLRRQRIGC